MKKAGTVKTNNYRIDIQYDGRRYNGWQKQNNTSDTIQGMVEGHLNSYLSKKCVGSSITEINASGRTDAGVHALCQTASFRTDCIFNCTELLIYMNSVLPSDIRILSVEPAQKDFHARLSAKGKSYHYYIDCGQVRNVFRRNYTYRIESHFNINAARKAASYLEGEHDFSAFHTHTKAMDGKSAVRIINSITINEKDGIVCIVFNGNGFLYNMVRILSGTIIMAATGFLDPEKIPEIIESKDRSMAGPTAPSNALFLAGAEY